MGQSAGIDVLSSKESPLKSGEIIAFFGDSITQSGADQGGYCRLIADAISRNHADLNVQTIFAGISGNRVPDLLARIERDVLAKKPTVVFVYIGINDVWHSSQGRGTPRDVFEAGLRDIVKQLSAANAKVVLCTPSTIGEKTDGSNPLDKMLEDYSEITRAVAQETNVTLCDLRKAFVEYLKKNNPKNQESGILTTDGVHLNAEGNKFVANQAALAIAKALSNEKPAGQSVSLFNGKDLTGWHYDIPSLDDASGLNTTFVVRDGNLVSMGKPEGHLITDAVFENYRLEVEYRFAGEPGNCGVLVHASKPRALYKMFPQSIEVQMNHTHAGDFWCIVEDITVPNMVQRRGAEKDWGITEGKLRRILNLTDDSEKPLGEWNRMQIECVEDNVKVWVNGDLVNHGTGCTASKGQIALQAEGAEVEFRKLLLTPITKLTD